MMQQIAPGPYKTAHYTFATALMGACMMITGAVSGYIQTAVGYQWFFIIVLIAAAPSILATILAPFHPTPTSRSRRPAPERENAAGSGDPTASRFLIQEPQLRCGGSPQETIRTERQQGPRPPRVTPARW